MIDMTVSPFYALNGAGVIPPAQEAQEGEPDLKTLLTTADMLEFSARGLSSLSNPAGLGKPLGAQILGFGSVTARQPASSAWNGGSAVTHFTTEYEFSYFDLVNGTITKTVSSGAGALASNESGSASASVFQGHTVCVTFDAASYRAGDLQETLDSMAAAYQAKYVGLESSYTGKALEDQRAQWEALYGAGKEAAAHSFAKLLGKSLGQDDQAAQEKKVYDSVQGLFAAYEAKYRSLTASLGTKGWMQADLYAASMSLQQLGEPAALEEDKASGLYSQRELEFAAVNLSAYQVAVHAATLGGGGSEARQAMRMSMLSMKTETMASRGLIGQEMAQLLRTSGEKARQALLEGLDHFLAKRREGGADAEQAFPAVDRGMFDAVYDSVMEYYHRNGDPMNALREGAVLAYTRLCEAVAQVPAQRWSGELGVTGFWESFDSASYHGGIHGFAVDWQEFLEEFDSTKRDLNALA